MCVHCYVIELCYVFASIALSPNESQAKLNVTNESEVTLNTSGSQKMNMPQRLSKGEAYKTVFDPPGLKTTH